MLLIQFQDFGSYFLLLLFIVFPWVYLGFYKPYFKNPDSKLWTVKVMDWILSSFAHVFLWATPLMIFLISPTFGFIEFFLVSFRLIYIALFFIFVTLVVVDIFVYGWQFIFYVGDVGLEDQKSIRSVLKELNIKVRRKK